MLQLRSMYKDIYSISEFLAQTLILFFPIASIDSGPVSFM